MCTPRRKGHALGFVVMWKERQILMLKKFCFLAPKVFRLLENN
jgi:hypothetical protein